MSNRDSETTRTSGTVVALFHNQADAERAIRDLARLGIRIKVISGDNRYVTAHLAEAVGLNAKAILTGDELAKLKDEALWHLAPRTDLFVEIDPQQKERIVRCASAFAGSEKTRKPLKVMPVSSSRP